MSAKSSRPGKKVTLPQPPPTPRAKDAIEQDYGRLVAQAGQCQYQVHVYTKELEALNNQLQSLNYEAAARNQLDAKAATTPSQEHANVQS